MMRDLIGGLPEEVSERYELASPLHHVTAKSPPTLLLQGQRDHIALPESVRRLHRALLDAGVPSLCIEYPRTGHAFDLVTSPLLAAAAQAALHDVERYLACVTTRQEATREADPAHQELSGAVTHAA